MAAERANWRRDPWQSPTNPRADRGGRTVIFNGIREPGALPEVYRLTFPDGRVAQVTRANGAMAREFFRRGAVPPAVRHQDTAGGDPADGRGRCSGGAGLRGADDPRLLAVA